MDVILNGIFGLLIFIFKLLIGGAISYVLPSLCIQDIKENSHHKISIIGILTTAIFSIPFGEDLLAYSFIGGAIITGLIVASDSLSILIKSLL